VNRWNACGKEALRSAKELSQRPAPQVKFPAESPRRLDEERLPVRWRRIYDAPIAVGKTAAIVTEKIMKLSARNQLKGKVVEVHKGATTAHVVVDLGHGVTVTSSITNEAVDDLGLKVGDSVAAVIKASDVMIGK